MTFTVEVKRTNELTAMERSRLCSLFGSVFGRPMPEDLFLRKYRDAPCGDSLHCLAIQDGIAGSFAAIVQRYSFFGRDCLFAIAIDLMLEAKYRPNIALMRRMSEALYARLAESGVAFVFSCVREEMMRFHQVAGGWRQIGPLSYFVAPVRAPRYPGLPAVLRAAIRLANVLAGSGAATPAIDKRNDSLFRAWRYSFFPTDYRTAEAAAATGIYTGKTFWDLPGAPAGARLSFLIDVWPPTQAAIDAVVADIARREADIDYLIYPGLIPFQPRRMLRVPRRFEKPRYHLGGRILRPDVVDDRLYDLANWNVNLSNTDLA